MKRIFATLWQKCEAIVRATRRAAAAGRARAGRNSEMKVCFAILLTSCPISHATIFSQTPQKAADTGKRKSTKGTPSRKSAGDNEVDPRAHLIEPHIESYNYFVLVLPSSNTVIQKVIGALIYPLTAGRAACRSQGSVAHHPSGGWRRHAAQNIDFQRTVSMSLQNFHDNDIMRAPDIGWM